MSKNVFDLEVKVKQVNDATTDFTLYTSDCWTSTCYTSTCWTNTCYSADCWTGQNMCGYTHTTGC